MAKESESCQGTQSLVPLLEPLARCSVASSNKCPGVPAAALWDGVRTQQPARKVRCKPILIAMFFSGRFKRSTEKGLGQVFQIAQTTPRLNGIKVKEKRGFQRKDGCQCQKINQGQAKCTAPSIKQVYQSRNSTQQHPAPLMHGCSPAQLPWAGQDKQRKHSTAQHPYLLIHDESLPKLPPEQWHFCVLRWEQTQLLSHTYSILMFDS